MLGSYRVTDDVTRCFLTGPRPIQNQCHQSLPVPNHTVFVPVCFRCYWGPLRVWICSVFSNSLVVRGSFVASWDMTQGGDELTRFPRFKDQEVTSHQNLHFIAGKKTLLDVLFCANRSGHAVSPLANERLRGYFTRPLCPLSAHNPIMLRCEDALIMRPEARVKARAQHGALFSR